MKILSVPDMHCGRCVERIDKAFAAAGIACGIDLAAKTVSVAEESVAEAIKLLDELGFEAV